MQTTGQLVDRQ